MVPGYDTVNVTQAPEWKNNDVMVWKNKSPSYHRKYQSPPEFYNKVDPNHPCMISSWAVLFRKQKC